MNNIFRKSFILDKNKIVGITKTRQINTNNIKNNLNNHSLINTKTTKNAALSNINNAKSNNNVFDIDEKSNIGNNQHKSNNSFKSSQIIKRNNLDLYKNNIIKNNIKKNKVKNTENNRKYESNFKSKKYSIIECFDPGVGIKKIVMEDIAKGFNVKLVPIKSSPCNGLNVIMGILRGSETLLKKCINENKDFLYIDHAYFNRGHNNGYKSYYRTCLNNLTCNFIDEHADDKRLKMFNVKQKPWNTKGSQILICPPTDAIVNFYGNENWLDDIIQNIRNYTDRKFKIKFKYIDDKNHFKKKRYNVNLKEVNKAWRQKYIKYVCDRPIKEDYPNTWCLITFSSTVALEAILEGVPVICGSECCAYPVSQHDISQIENPIYPDTYKWLCTLANHQFSREEMVTGYAWSFLGL